MRSHRYVGRCAVALALVSAAALLGLCAPQAHASCVGQMIAVGTTIDTASPPTTGTVTLGEPVTVTGKLFHLGCADTYQTTGCSGTPTPVDPETPMSGVDLVLTQDGRSWTLGTQDASGADQMYAITWHVTLPDAVHAGPATLTARDASLAVTVVA